MRFRGWGSLLLSALLCAAFAGCSSSMKNASGPPSITSQPASHAVMVGQTATFMVTAAGATPLTYQWSKNGTGISGATSASYTTPAATLADNGAQFTVTIGNSLGKATSNAATLTVTAAAAGTDVLTYHNDVARTGQNLNETTLTPANLNSSTFGKIGFDAADGLVDAQPLVVSNLTIPGQGVHNVLYVVSEHDSAYAYDADNGASLWQVSLLPAGETTSDDRGCGQVTPEIGITSTPVIDRTRGPNGAIYIVAMSKNGGQYFQRIHAVDLATGAELFGGPKVVQASYPGTGDNSSGGNVIFDPAQYKERAGLLLLNGVLYTGWASHCDITPYTGWIIAYDPSSLAQTTVLNVTPNGSEGSLWNSGAGPAADAAGNIYFLDANGDFDTTLNANGFPSSGDFGNAFIKLSTSGGLAVADYFATFDTVQQSSVDGDLGSGGALVLPDLKDNVGKTWHLAVGAGKDGNIYVVNRDSMGKFNPSANNNYQTITGGVSGGVFAMPAYFNNTIFYGDVGGTLKAFAISNAQLSNAPIAQTANSFGYPGTTPAISANGTSNAIVWAVENSSPAVLHAYDATNLANELYNSNQAGSRDQFGNGNKFITPTIVNGKVYVGTPNGVAIFGLLP